MRGYGRITITDRRAGTKRVRIVHRLVYELETGSELRSGDIVMHTCDNPSCCNPRHLKVGTQLDNVRDRDAKGRTHRGLKPARRGKATGDDNGMRKFPGILSGEKNGRALITDEQAEAIKAEYAAGGISYAALGARYGVSKSCVFAVVAGVNWKRGAK
jgi:hypothetical protein